MCSRSRLIVAAFVIATGISAARPSAAFAQQVELRQPRAQTRPTIGLALGGGAARGLAHIGLLRWFEEHRIPVDYLAVETKVIADLLGARQAGKPLVRGAIEDSILRMSGTDRYEVVKYYLEAGPDGVDLVVRVTPKTHRPPFLMTALDVQSIDANTFAVSVRGRLTLLDSPLPNSELRIDAGVGTDQTMAGELYKRF